MRRLGSRGDTIVEVMIALGIAGLMIVTASVLTSRSLKNTLQAQEHGQAQKIAESQVEQLKSAYNKGVVFFEDDKYYCFTLTGTPTVSSSFDNMASVPAGCRGGGHNFITGSRFDDLGDGRGIFLTEVNWEGITGQTDRVQLSTGVYK